MSPGRKWAAVAAASVALIVAAAFFATGHAVMLVLLVGWHAVLIALPMAAAVFAGLRAGTSDLTILGLYGLACGGLSAYALFWVWRFAPPAGALATIAFIAACGAAIGWLVSRLEREAMRKAIPLGVAMLVWACYGLFILAFALAPLGFQSPMGAVQHHFALPLPYDNVLPWLFAKQITEEKVTIPMVEAWLTSDRPPLQTAYFLASAASLFPRNDFHYQVQSTLLQALWAPGMWLLLRSFNLVRGAAFAALAVGMFSGFALINGIFTWPKLFPVAYLAVATAVLLDTRPEAATRGAAAGVGACVALAYLGHPGSVLILAGLGLTLLFLRRVPRGPFLAIAAATAIAIVLPWSLYQKFVDPPGNRLLKWHLAGVVEVDGRSVFEAVRDAYAGLTLEEYVEGKIKDLKFIVGPEDSAGLTLKASTVGVDDQQAWRLRIVHFLHIVSTLGMLALAPLAWLVPMAWRKREFTASLRLAAICVLTIAPWIFLLFTPGSTIIHHGSYAVVCFLFAAAVLALYAASPWLAVVGVGLHAMLTYQAYTRGAPLAEGANAADYRAFDALAVVALAITCYGLWKLCAYRAPDNSASMASSGWPPRAAP
jgi:hypothetical protein